MKAVITYEDLSNDVQLVEINGHDIQLGGTGGGFCYPHQSFDCIDNLTPEELIAIQNAETKEQK